MTEQSRTEKLVRGAYEAFNSRDVEATILFMHADIDWPNGWEGGRVRGHDGVRAYWSRQFKEIDTHVEPIGMEEDGQTVKVHVHQIVCDSDTGNVISDSELVHIYKLRDGLIQRMDIEPEE
jgi:hypothetical protein